MPNDQSTRMPVLLRLHALLAALLLAALLTGTVSALTGPAPPTASFSASEAGGFAPFFVSFSDASTGEGIADWAWEFGDGGTSTERNPVHTYTAAGNYTVTLTVTNAGGADSEVKTGYITVVPEMPFVDGSQMSFLVSTEPAGAEISIEDISGARYVIGTTADGPVNITLLIMATPVMKIIANLSGYGEAVWEITERPGRDETLPVTLTLEPIAPSAIFVVRDGTGLPMDTDGDNRHDDVNGNGRKDFADVVLYYNQMSWIAANEPLAAFDYNNNGRIDFADVVWLFNTL